MVDNNKRANTDVIVLITFIVQRIKLYNVISRNYKISRSVHVGYLYLVSCYSYDVVTENRLCFITAMCQLI